LVEGGNHRGGLRRIASPPPPDLSLKTSRKDNNTQHASVQFSADRGSEIVTATEGTTPCTPVVPAVTTVVSGLPQTAIVAAPSPPEANQPQSPAPGEKAASGQDSRGGAKNSDLPRVEITHPQAKQASPTAAPAAKVSSGPAVPSKLAQKSKAIATRESSTTCNGCFKTR